MNWNWPQFRGKKVYSAQHLNWDISASLNRDGVKPLFKCSPEQGSLAPALSLHKALFLMEAASIQMGIQTLAGLALSQPFSAAPRRPVGCCTLGDLKGRLPALCQESHSSLKCWFGGHWHEVGIPCQAGGDSLWTPGVINTFFCWIPAQIIIKLLLPRKIVEWHKHSGRFKNKSDILLWLA